MSRVRKTQDKTTSLGRKFLGELLKMKGRPYVKVGIQTEQFQEPKRESSKGKSKRTPRFKVQTLGQVAIDNEFGTDKIPERSVIRAVADKKQKGEWMALYKRLMKQVAAGTMTTEKALGLMGERMTADQKHGYRSNTPPPNAPMTIRMKRSSKTLINTGQLANAPAYKVVTNGK